MPSSRLTAALRSSARRSSVPRQFEVLGDRGYFVAFDTAPPQVALPLDWMQEVPPSYRDSEMGLQIVGLSAVLTSSAVVGNRRLQLDFQTAGGVSYCQLLSGPQAASLVRRHDFQAGMQAGTPSGLIREPMPDGLVLFPGHILRIDVEGRAAGDVLGVITIRGRMVRP